MVSLTFIETQKMINDEICTYDVCKLAKEKGFNEYEVCNHVYEDDNQWHTLTTYTNAKGIDWSKDKFTVAPTQSLLQRWLREEKFIDIEIYPIFIKGVRVYTVCIHASNLNKPNRFNYFDTYELTLEDALKYTLENLI